MSDKTDARCPDTEPIKVKFPAPRELGQAGLVTNAGGKLSLKG